MGQYQQWLYQREVDQQLRAQLALLEEELQHLQEQTALLGDVNTCTDNPIVQAIAMQQSAESLLVDPAQLSPIAESSSTTETELPGVSSALFAWSRLPNLNTHEIQLQTTQFMNEEPEIETAPHPEVTLLPEDMAAFIDTHTPTVPRLHASRLVRPSELKITTRQEAASDDRTDYSIQRWRERWGRDTLNPAHTSFNQQKPQEDTTG